MFNPRAIRTYLAVAIGGALGNRGATLTMVEEEEGGRAEKTEEWRI